MERLGSVYGSGSAEVQTRSCKNRHVVEMTGSIVHPWLKVFSEVTVNESALHLLSNRRLCDCRFLEWAYSDQSIDMYVPNHGIDIYTNLDQGVK